MPGTQISCNPHYSQDTTEFSSFHTCVHLCKRTLQILKPFTSWKTLNFKRGSARIMVKLDDENDPLFNLFLLDETGHYHPDVASILISALLIANQSRSNLFSILADIPKKSWRTDSSSFRSIDNSDTPDKENLDHTVTSTSCGCAHFIWKWIMDRWPQLLETHLDLSPAFKVIDYRDFSSHLILSLHIC